MFPRLCRPQTVTPSVAVKAAAAEVGAEPAVEEALNTLVEQAWSEEAKDCARGALMQLTDRQRETVAAIDLDALHIMMSCECPHFSFVL